MRAPIVAWGTTLTTGRQESPTEVNVATVRQRVDMATVPESDVDAGYALCNDLFGDHFVKRDGLLAIALSNLNPQNHLAIALLNLTRMERGETWGQGENVTPAVGRLIEALDRERLAIAEAFGLRVKTVQEHFSLSFHVHARKRLGDEPGDARSGPGRLRAEDGGEPLCPGGRAIRARCRRCRSAALPAGRRSCTRPDWRSSRRPTAATSRRTTTCCPRSASSALSAADLQRLARAGYGRADP